VKRITSSESVEIAAANSPPAVLKGPQLSSAQSYRSRFRELQKDRPGFSTAKYANHANKASPTTDLGLARFIGRPRPQQRAGVAAAPDVSESVMELPFVAVG
jgi:hypothetical protein